MDHAGKVLLLGLGPAKSMGGGVATSRDVSGDGKSYCESDDGSGERTHSVEGAGDGEERLQVANLNTFSYDVMGTGHVKSL